MKPIIGISMGDAAGIGPEIIVKALSNKYIYDISNPIVIGNSQCLKKVLDILALDMSINKVEDIQEAKFEYGIIDIFSIDNEKLNEVEFGEISSTAGAASFEYVKKTAQLAVEGIIDVMVTAPINKESIKAAGVPHIGHTEMLADITEVDDPLTMFQVHDLRVFFLSRHVSLKKACSLVTEERIKSCVRECSKALGQLGVDNATIAIAGLNPHSGEHGLFGEEEREIEKAVSSLKEYGVNVAGPISADSVFYQALKGKYQAVLSLYHDQGHIATKTLDFERTISLTLGMPFLRTSVDHGTAFDIAGKGIASDVSMQEAIRLAAVYGLKYRLRGK